MSFKTFVSLLTFCLDDLPIDVGGVLMSPSIILLLYIFLFVAVSICFIYWGAPILGAYIFIIVLFIGLIPWSLGSVLLCLLLQSLF